MTVNVKRKENREKKKRMRKKKTKKKRWNIIKFDEIKIKSKMEYK